MFVNGDMTYLYRIRSFEVGNVDYYAALSYERKIYTNDYTNAYKIFDEESSRRKVVVLESCEGNQDTPKVISIKDKQNLLNLKE